MSIFILSLPGINCLSAIAQTPSVTSNSQPSNSASTGGTTSVNNDLANLTIAPQILTYKALSKVLPLLVEKAKSQNIPLDNSNIIIQTDAQEIKTALSAYAAYHFQLDPIVNSCKKLVLPKTPTENNLSITSFSQTLNTILGLSTTFGSILDTFRNQTTISPVTTEIAEDALVAELATTLNNNYKNVKIYYPKLLQPQAGLQIIIDELQPVSDCNERIKQKTRTQTQEIQDLSTIIDKFFNQLLGSKPDTTPSSPNPTPSSISSQPVILDIIKGAKLNELLNSKDNDKKSKGYILYVYTKAGGNNQLTRNFFTGTKLRSNGGVIFYYQLIDSEGVIKLSGVESFYTKLQTVPTGSTRDF